jgi:hypothetical protein
LTFYFIIFQKRWIREMNKHMFKVKNIILKWKKYIYTHVKKNNIPEKLKYFVIADDGRRSGNRPALVPESEGHGARRRPKGRTRWVEKHHGRASPPPTRRAGACPKHRRSGRDRSPFRL